MMHFPALTPLASALLTLHKYLRPVVVNQYEYKALRSEPVAGSSE